MSSHGSTFSHKDNCNMPVSLWISSMLDEDIGKGW